MIDIFDFILKEDAEVNPVRLVSAGAEGFSPKLDVKELSGYLSPRLPTLAFSIPKGAKRVQIIPGKGIFSPTAQRLILADEEALMAFFPKASLVDAYVKNDQFIVIDILAWDGEWFLDHPLEKRLTPILDNPAIILQNSDPLKLEETNFFPEGSDRVLFKPANMIYPKGTTTEPNWLIQSKPNKNAEQDILKELSYITSDQQIAMEMFGLDLSKNKVAEREYEVKILKAVEDEEKRLVYGIVLRPNDIDSQIDIMTPREVEKTCHFYMAVHGIIGYRHRKEIQAIPVESYIAPVNFMLDLKEVKKGDWVLVTFIADDEIWADIQSGKINGYSVGGNGIRRVIAA